MGSDNKFIHQDFAELCRDAVVLNDVIYHKKDILASVENHEMYHNIRSIAATMEMDDGLKYTLARSTDTLYLTIRGSDNLENWKSNLKIHSPILIGSHSGRLHKGFWELANKLPFSYLKHQANKNEIKRIVFTGHSLGGATAAIAALKFMDMVDDKSKVQCITFGAPFFGDKTLRKELYRREQKDHFYNFVGVTDIVPIIMNQFMVRALFSYCPIGHFQVLDDELESKQIEHHMKKGPPIFSSLRRETIQRHMMPYYVKEIDKYWASIPNIPFTFLEPRRSFNSDDGPSSHEHVKKLDTSVRYQLSLTRAVLGAIDSTTTSLLIEIVGNENIGLLEHLTANDLIFDHPAWRSGNITVKTKLRSAIKMSYVVTLCSCDTSLLPSVVTCKFWSRFSKDREQIKIPVTYSPPCRKQRIKDGNTLETILHIHYSLNAETQLKSGNEALMENLIKEYEDSLKDLDRWLYLALEKLSKKQQEMLKAVIYSEEIGRGKMTAQESFHKVRKTLKGLKKSSWRKMESYWPKQIQRSEHESKELPKDFFTNLVKNGRFFEDQIVLKTEIILATAVCLVFNNTTNRKSNFSRDFSFSTKASRDFIGITPFTRRYEHFIMQFFKKDLPSISYSNFGAIQSIIGNVTKGYKKDILSFVQPFCSNAARLRHTLLKNDPFTIGIVGQPQSGKSTVTSIFNSDTFGLEEKKDLTTTSSFHRTCCSDQINLIEIRSSNNNDTSVRTLHDVAQIFDAVVIFVKAMDNTYTEVKDFVKIVDVPIFVCITHVDEALKKRFAALDEYQANPTNKADKYEIAMDDLLCWRRQFCRRNDVHLSNAHFIIPNHLLEENAEAADKSLIVGDNSPIKDVSRLVEWLFEITEEFNELDLDAALQYQYRRHAFHTNEEAGIVFTTNKDVSFLTALSDLSC